MDRQLVEVKLKLSGCTAKVVSYFLYGESKEIDAKQWEGAKIRYGEGGVQFDEIPVDYQKRQDDVLLLVGVKEIRKPDGATMEVKKETFDSLPEQDVRAIVFELVKARQLSESDKKK